MPSIEGSKTIYVPPKHTWIFEKFSLDELSLLLKKGAILFEYMAETPKSKMLIESDKEFASVIEKW